MRISDWSSDVCSSDLVAVDAVARRLEVTSSQVALAWIMARGVIPIVGATRAEQMRENMAAAELQLSEDALADLHAASAFDAGHPYSMLDWDMPIALGYGGMFDRSEEHTSELQSLLRISYAVFCLKQ